MGGIRLARRSPIVAISTKLATLTMTLALIGVMSTAQPAHASPAFGTLLVRGQDWLGGRGVDVYSNGDYRYCCGPSNYVNGVYVGIKWQCVELAQRLYTARGWYKGSFGVNYAYQIFDRASAIGMKPHPNGDGYVPVPGDLIIGDKPVPTYQVMYQLYRRSTLTTSTCVNKTGAPRRLGLVPIAALGRRSLEPVFQSEELFTRLPTFRRTSTATATSTSLISAFSSATGARAALATSTATAR
jgi:hypothetical protein